MKKLITQFIVLCFVLTLGTSCTLDNSNTPMSSIDTTSEFLLNIVAEKGGTVPSDLSGRYHAAKQIEVMVTPDPGYLFYRWTVYWNYPDVFPDTSFSNPYQLTMPDCDVTMVATFGESSELFSVTYSDGTGGGFAGGMVAQYTGNYYVGSIC